MPCLLFVRVIPKERFLRLRNLGFDQPLAFHDRDSSLRSE